MCKSKHYVFISLTRSRQEAQSIVKGTALASRFNCCTLTALSSSDESEPTLSAMGYLENADFFVILESLKHMRWRVTRTVTYVSCNFSGEFITINV